MRYIHALAVLLVLVSGASAAEASVIDRLRQDQTLRIGHRTDASPFSFVNDIGEPAGFSIELCKAVAADIKKQLSLPTLQATYVPVSSTDRFDAVTSGKIDLECGTSTMTLKRRESVDFSLPIYVTGASLLVRSGAATNFKELNGKRVGVVKATTTETVLVQTLQALEITAEIIRTGGYDEGIAKLEAGDLAAFFGDRTILAGLLAERPNSGKLRLSSRLLSAEQYALTLPKGDPDFRLLVDRALAHIYRSGQIVDIHSRFFGDWHPDELLEVLYLINALPAE